MQIIQFSCVLSEVCMHVNVRIFYNKLIIKSLFCPVSDIILFCWIKSAGNSGYIEGSR